VGIVACIAIVCSRTILIYPVTRHFSCTRVDRIIAIIAISIFSVGITRISGIAYVICINVCVRRIVSHAIAVLINTVAGYLRCARVDVLIGIITVIPIVVTTIVCAAIRAYPIPIAIIVHTSRPRRDIFIRPHVIACALRSAIAVSVIAGDIGICQIIICARINTGRGGGGSLQVIIATTHKQWVGVDVVAP
jgi:hypothetical protein